MYPIFDDFVKAVIQDARTRITSYCGSMLIDIVHNRGGDEILVIWANYETQKGENYSFPIIDGEKYTEEYNAGNDFSGYKYQLVNDMFNKMIHVESTQTGRPIR